MFYKYNKTYPLKTDAWLLPAMRGILPMVSADRGRILGLEEFIPAG